MSQSDIANQRGLSMDPLKVPIRSITIFKTKKIQEIFNESIQDI